MSAEKRKMAGAVSRKGGNGQKTAWLACAGAVVLGMSMASSVEAATFAWDPAKTPSGTSANPVGSGGNGLWQADEAVAHWSNGTTDTSWGSGTQAGNTALFAGTPGTVTIGSNVRPGGIAFGVSGYTLAPGSSVIATPFSTGPGTDLAASNTSTMVIDTGAGFSNTVSATFNGGGNANFIGGMFTVQGTGSVTLGGSGTNSQARAVVANGATLVLGKTSVFTDQYALGTGASVANQALVIQSGGTVRLGGSGNNQIRDRGGKITVSGTLDMNGRSEAVGPAIFNNATLNFTLGAALGANDILFLSSNADVAVSAFATSASKGAATVSGSNIINIAARDGVTSLAEGDYTLMYASSGLGTGAWSLGSSSIIVGGTTYSLSLSNSTTGAEILTVTQVPEPAALGLAGLVLAIASRRSRRR